MSVSYVKTSNGNINFYIKSGKSNDSFAGVVPSNHPNYAQLYQVLSNAAKNRDATAKVIRRVKNLLSELGIVKAIVGKVKVHEKGITIDGKEVKGVVVNKILELREKKLDIKPLCYFLAKVSQNPSEQSQKALYNWLDAAGMIIDNEGNILGYKSVTKDFKDHHTGTFDNSIGKQPSEPRDVINTDPNVACGRGLHVGSLEYATTFRSGSKIIVVKVNPIDVVSVPNDEQHQKMRVSTYLVVDELKDYVRLKQEDYVKAAPEDDDWDDELDDDFEDEDDFEEECEDCLNVLDDCECEDIDEFEDDDDDLDDHDDLDDELPF